MIALCDGGATSRRVSWVTLTLFAANVIAFALQLHWGSSGGQFIYRYGVVPAHWLVDSAMDLLDWPKLFLALLTSQFLHGGILHLGSSMLYLWIFGRGVEQRLGAIRFLALYLGSGIVAGLVHILSSQGSRVPMVGSSGAVAGILGGYLLLFASGRGVALTPIGFSRRVFRISAFLFLGVWFLLQWWEGLFTIGQVAQVGGLAFWCHIGGFVAGMVGVVILIPRKFLSY